jgi:kumamolisin
MKKLMNMRHSAGSLVMAAALLATCATITFAQSGDTPTGITIPSSSIASSADAGVAAHTNLQILGPGAMSVTPLSAGPPVPGLFYETPASIACIYGLQPPVAGCNPNVTTLNPKGGKKAIAIVDAYDQPNAFGDLQHFSTQFGLTPITPATFQVVFAPHSGATPGTCAGPATRPPSGVPTGWTLEESLDIEWAHAMAPAATLYLVEAQSNSLLDLFCAVAVAGSLVNAAGGGEISMSWGSGEFAAEVTLDHIFTAPNVVYLASSGDRAGAFYPTSSPNVVSVGGTTLSTNATTGQFENENVWQSTGGGPSRYEARPSYQNAIAGIVGARRGTPDISSDANPITGVWVYDSVTVGFPAWFVVGGTSVSSPTWAGILNAQGVIYASSQAALTHLYGNAGSFHDITKGNCGPYISQNAQEGWDFCTGLGSPGRNHGDD